MDSAGSDLFTIGAIFIVFILLAAYNWYTQLDTEEISEVNSIMMNFHKNPSRDDFEYVYARRNKISRLLGKSFNFWMWGVHCKYPEIYSNIDQDYVRDIARGLRRAVSDPTPDLLDCIWCLYFATGDAKYSEIVRRIAVGEIPAQDKVVTAAKWSWGNIMGTELTPTQ